eukprot:2737699-Pleurochrysis_carterae.AAC.1
MAVAPSVLGVLFVAAWRGRRSHHGYVFGIEAVSARVCKLGHKQLRAVRQAPNAEKSWQLVRLACALQATRCAYTT